MFQFHTQKKDLNIPTKRQTLFIAWELMHDPPSFKLTLGLKSQKLKSSTSNDGKIFLYSKLQWLVVSSHEQRKPM